MEACLRNDARIRACRLVSMFLLLASPLAGAQTIPDYANACGAAIGEQVPAFSCIDDGHEIPMKGTEGVACEKPPYLPFAGCYGGSRIGQLQAADPDVLMVFLCRKKRPGNQPHQFDDIAVIQTNYTTGATCFYQRLADGTDGRKVPAPKDDIGNFWMDLPTMASPDNACVQCHDNGPFLRTPYVMQLKDRIPAYDAKYRNKTHYFFPGQQWLGWNGKTFRVTVRDNTNCTVCHTMGANTIDPSVGTSSWLGPYSTGLEQTPFLKDPVTGNGTAHWMKPKQAGTGPSQDDMLYSEIWRNCALGSNGDCTLELWGGQMTTLREERAKRPGRAEQRPR